MSEGIQVTSLRRAVEREVLLPNTLPVRFMDDLTPYHWHPVGPNRVVLRKGAPPKARVEAAAALGAGQITLDEFLTRIGVPNS